MELRGHIDAYPRLNQSEAIEALKDLAAAMPNKIESADYKGMDYKRFSSVLPVGGDAYDRFIDICTRFDVRRSLRHEPVFAREERDSAELLILRTGGSITDWSPHESGTVIDKHICPRCGLSYFANQRGPLYLRSAKTLKGLRWGHVESGGPFWLVSDELAELLRSWNLTGFLLGEVFTHGGKLLPMKQVIPTWTLPDLAPSAPMFYGDRGVCPECHLYGSYVIALHYRRSDLGELKDVGLAPVYNSRNMLGEGKPIISQRLNRLMKQAGVKGYTVDPVFIEGE